MIRVMIVDDEVIIRRGLSTVIDWHGLGLQLLEPASSAEEALERIPAERPHILLTDIKMAEKDGLELVHAAKSMIPDIQAVILTGFDNFHYAQQAIREGVSDYLLKTSRPEEIIKAVMKAKQHLQQAWEHAKQDQMKRNAYRNQSLERLLTESAENIDMEHLLEQLPNIRIGVGQGHSLQVAIISAKGWGGAAAYESLLQFAVENSLNELVDCETLSHKDELVAIVRHRLSPPDLTGLQAAAERIRTVLKCDLFIAMGTAVQGYEDLKTSYAEARYAFSFDGLLSGAGAGLATYERLRARKGGRHVCSVEEDAELARILREGNSIEFKDWTSRKVREQLADPELTPASLHAYLRSIVLSGERWLERVAHDLGAGSFNNAAQGGSALQSFQQTSGQPEEALFKSLHALMETYRQSVSEQRASYVQRAIVYIKENLSANITLSQVAREVHVHPNHFSEVFKRETGLNYIEFVTQERIRRACDILLRSPAKIGEVAKQVGYEDVKYFSQLFKKYTGQTPSEYRDNN